MGSEHFKLAIITLTKGACQCAQRTSADGTKHCRVWLKYT